MTLQIRRFLPFCLLLALASCQPSATIEPTDTEQGASETIDESALEETTSSDIQDKLSDSGNQPTKAPEQKSSGSAPITAALQPGTYCYQIATETEDVDTRLTISANDRVTGKLQGAVHNEKAGYYTSYTQKLDGTINGSNLDLDVATWIEYDQQNKQETWKVSARQLNLNDGTTLDKADCAEVSKIFQNESGLEAEDLTASAKNVKTQQVNFEPGKSGTTVKGAVVRGDRDVYTLIAQSGQQMDLNITSLEDNAVFDVVAPSGLILGTEMQQKKVFLPHTGEYSVIVGGTRGNVIYDLAIAIK